MFVAVVLFYQTIDPAGYSYSSEDSPHEEWSMPPRGSAEYPQRGSFFTSLELVLFELVTHLRSFHLCEHEWDGVWSTY